jgi:UDP:flavonoid glycosyltransferase YjiC (YdhE family)
MRRRVLLTWETGAGRTHAEHLKGVALALRDAGCDCTVLHFNTRFAPEFVAHGLSSLQAPVWPARLGTERPWFTRRGRCIIDGIANLGAADPDALAGILLHYETLFRMLQPDLVVGESGYGAGMAARARIPFVAVGSSSSIAPLTATRVEPYRVDGPPPGWPDEELVARVNEGLRRAGRPAIALPRDILAADRRFCMTLQECDVYAGRRDEPLLPPMVGPHPPRPETPGAEIFLYLHGFEQGNDALMAGLMTSGRRVRAYIPGLSADMTELLTAYGVTIEAEPVPLARIASTAGAVVHHGGGQLVAQLLALGIPQILLMKEITNRISGASVQRLGVGCAIEHDEVTVAWLDQSIESVFGSAVRARAAALAPAYTAVLGDGPVSTIAAACLELMGA